MADETNSRKQNFDRPWYKYAFELIKDFPRSTNVLDLGCGFGEFSQILRKKGFDVVCADGSKKCIDFVKNKGVEAYCLDFNSKLPFENRSFDLIVSLEVIEHLENAELFLSEISRILKPRGHLIISTPNVAYLGLRLRGLLGLPPIDEGYHYRFFSFNSLKKLVEKNGFELIKNNSITFLHGIHKILQCKPLVIKVNLLTNLFAIKSIILFRKIK